MNLDDDLKVAGAEVKSFGARVIAWCVANPKTALGIVFVAFTILAAIS